jgi:hypothetical protein
MTEKFHVKVRIEYVTEITSTSPRSAELRAMAEVDAPTGHMLTVGASVVNKGGSDR